MSFENLNKGELEDIAKFFVVDVEAADDEKGPTKKELVAALASGDDPVTWEQYKEVYLPAKESGQDKVDDGAPDIADVKEPESKEEPDEDDSDKVLIRFTGNNPRLDMVGYTFSKDHPFHSVDSATAEYLVRNGPFRLALHSEVSDYYN